MTEILTIDSTIIDGIKDEKNPKDWLISRLNDLNVAIGGTRNAPNLENLKFPSELVFLSKGLDHKIDDDVPLEKPSWYDDEKFKRGQKFANDYYGMVNYAEMITLLILFSFHGNLGPLIYTRRSDTSKKAGKRYLSTALRVLSWYEEDVWDKNSVSHKNIKMVRAYHRSTVKRMSKHSKQELEQKTRLRNVLSPTEIKCQALATLKGEFSGTCPFWISELSHSGTLINQVEMSLTLFGFMGLIVLYPEKLGVIGVTEEELDGFVHLWRVLGYLLGIKDEFNLCQGPFNVVKSRCQQIIDMLFIPNLNNLTEEWEHMSRCMIEGVAMTIPGPTFETSMLHLFWITGVKSVKYRRRLKWKYIAKHYFNRFIMSCIMRFVFIRVKFNTWVKNQMRLKAVTMLNEMEDNVTDFNENR
uniref:Amylopullulanase n=1 Tax=Lygus hesperus TaxID=30085 RepID=A0A0A9XA16_LYGHE